MDEIDLVILRKLLYNCRLTYRELAELTDMSVSAIHKRIKKLEDDGTIHTYIARPSLMALKYINVVIFGMSNAKSMDMISEELGQHDCIDGVGILGGKRLYIGVILRDILELQELSSYVSKVGQITEPTVGILNYPYSIQPESLSNTDYKILKTLNRDARKPIVDIADDIGLSARTVRRRIDRMIENNLVSFTLEWLPLYESTFITVFHLYLNEGVDINSRINHLSEIYSQNMIYIVSFSNIPNLILLSIWNKTAQDSQRILGELQTEGFKDVIPHIFYSMKWYDCWLDQLLRSK